MSVHFLPTRLNVADDPTRDVLLRDRCEGRKWFEGLGQKCLYQAADLPRAKRWASNWISLFLGLSFRNGLGLGAISLPVSRSLSSRPFANLYQHLLDFDATLGFPGEGPRFSPVGVIWILLVVFGLCHVKPCHGMRLRNREDEKRTERRSGLFLAEGRPVETVTKSMREKLLEAFDGWLRQRGMLLSEVLECSYKDPEQLVKLLVQYGREQYRSGRPYNHYAETVNAISAVKPTVRRLLTGAWDLAFSWQREEPGRHHTACPYQILLALCSCSILWGLPWVAGAIALSWGAACRIGEILAACRDDLVIPADVGYTSMRVKQPKTRYKAARHQMSGLDAAGLVQLVALAFGQKAPSEKLWPFSGQLLRTRFKQLLAALGLPSHTFHGEKCLDLGSLRAGGATFLLMQTEDPELVKRRGRWMASRTMDIYFPELSATVFFPRLPSDVKMRVLELAHTFPALLASMSLLVQAKGPPEQWFSVLTMNGTDGGHGMNSPGHAASKGAAQREANQNEANEK